MPWGLGRVRAVLCNPRHPRHDQTLAAYEANLAILEGLGDCQEDPAVLELVAPYRHAAAAMLTVSRGIQTRVKECLGLECDYVRPRGSSRSFVRRIMALGVR